MRVRTVATTLALAASVGVAGAVLAPTAMADNVKTCSTTTTSVSPGNGHSNNFAQTTTETQTSACNSNSSTGSQTTTGPVTNPGGQAPPGQQ